MASLSWPSGADLSRVDVVALLLASLLLALCLFDVHRRRRDLANIPPGPTPWPLVGNLGFSLVPALFRRRFGEKPVDKNAMVLLTERAAVYGNVYSMFVGSQLMVVLNGYEAVKDALSNHPEVFSDRPDIPAITIMTKRKGELDVFVKG